MRRIIAVLSLILALTAGSAGVRAASRMPVVPFAVPGATEVKVAKFGAHEWRISYHAPGTWYAAVLAQLEREGWHSAYPAAYAPLSRTYLRSRPFGVCDMLEWVFVYFDPGAPEDAHIRVRRVVVFPWWRRLSRLSRLLAGDMLRQPDSLRRPAPKQAGQLGQTPDLQRVSRPLR